jgi:hypothetical protein
MNDETRQKVIIRQSSMNRACDLLMNEQRTANNAAAIPVESIKKLTRELEAFVLELDVPDTRVINPTTGKVEQQPNLVI